MKCGFCGKDNPDGAKRCKHCKAVLASQQSYVRGDGGGFSGSVNPSGSGTAQQGAGGTWRGSGTAQGNAGPAWQNTSGAQQNAGPTRQNTNGTQQSARSPFLGGANYNRMTELRNRSTLKAAKVIALTMVLVPVVFFTVIVVITLKVNREMQKQREQEIQELAPGDLAAGLLEYYGLSNFGYSIEQDTPNQYTMTVSGVDYKVVNYKNTATGKNNWRSNYFTGTFQRMTAGTIEKPIYESSFGSAVTDVQYSVKGLFPLWLNLLEINAVKNGTSNPYKWADEWDEAKSWTIIISIVIEDDYPVSEECFKEIKDALFFATEISIECPSGIYYYYPYEDRYVPAE